MNTAPWQSGLHPIVRKLFHYISITASFFMVWSLLTILQLLLFGFIPGVMDIEIRGMAVAPLLFSAVSAGIIAKYFEFTSVWIHTN